MSLVWVPYGTLTDICARSVGNVAKPRKYQDLSDAAEHQRGVRAAKSERIG
jgi:hypothetical protein